jgi:hypothetical protein
MNATEAALAGALSQTGFPFEHFIFQQATRHSWTTIPNRLYVDAEEDKTREMDLLCYKAEKGPEVTVYTALLISCKARTDKPWVLMTRPWPKQLPAWYPYPPVPTWTNSVPLRHELARSSWGVEYFNSAGNAGLHQWAEDSREEVFALQEFEALRDGRGDKQKPPRFKSLNDTSLYMGAMSLLKALAFELNAVEERRANEHERFAYQFNLIQMLDGDLYEASFASGQPVVRPVDRYRYFARTMLGGREHSARIDFCTKPALAAIFDDMATLHRFNMVHFNEKYRAFYSHLLSTQDRLDAMMPLVEPRLTGLFTTFLSKYPRPAPGWITVRYDKGGDTMTVELDCMAPIDEVRGTKYFIMFAEQHIRDVYKFSGSLVFDDDIPF